MEQLDAIFEPLDGGVSCKTIKERLTQLLGKTRDLFGFDYYCFKASVKVRDDGRKLVKLNDYPKVWLDQYSKSDYARIDPAAQHAIDHVAAVRLELLLDHCQDTKLKKRFIEDAKDLGICGGVTMPLHSPFLSGFVNFNGNQPNQSANFMGVAGAFSTRLAETLGRLCFDEDSGGGYHSLSVREKHVLYWGVNGKTAWETSIILGISQRTVIAHVVNSMKKLQCNNKYQMLSQIAQQIDGDPALDQFRIEL